MSKQIPLAPLDPLRRYSINQAIAYLGSSRATVYKNISAGTLKIIKDGKRTFVPGSEIVRRSSVSSAA